MTKFTTRDIPYARLTPYKTEDERQEWALAILEGRDPVQAIREWRGKDRLWLRMAMTLHLPHWVTGEGNADEPW
jgi:hypothetical protein